jgi:hypothetical protein
VYYIERRRRAQKNSEGKTLTANQWGGVLMPDEKPSDMLLATYVQQAYAAKLLGCVVLEDKSIVSWLKLYAVFSLLRPMSLQNV